jgi:hypothetical protein
MSVPVNIPLPTTPYLANCQWIKCNLDEMVRSHPDQWIAVHEGRVLAAGPDLGKVTIDARRTCPSPDIAYEFVAGASTIF